MSTPSIPVSSHLEEYKEVGANLRQYVNMRFAQLTLFVTVTAALIALRFAKDSALSVCQEHVLEAFGIFIALAFGAMEYRSTWWWQLYFRRALELEDILGLSQYKSRGITIDALDLRLKRGRTKFLRYFTATNATTALLVVVALAWLALLVLSRTRCVA